jgi:hypothetical protein
MENTAIEARAFRELSKVAEWLGVPVDTLMLKDEPAPPQRTQIDRKSTVDPQKVNV